MRRNRLLCALLAVFLCFTLTGCQMRGEVKTEKVSLTIKTPPISLGKVPGVGEAEAYDMLVAASERFREQYDQYDVEFRISRYNYLDEKEQIADKYGTPEAADLFFAGSYNIPMYAEKGWLLPLEDVVDEELRADIDASIWKQNTIGGCLLYTSGFLIPDLMGESTTRFQRLHRRDGQRSAYSKAQSLHRQNHCRTNW